MAAALEHITLELTGFELISVIPAVHRRIESAKHGITLSEADFGWLTGGQIRVIIEKNRVIS